MSRLIRATAALWCSLFLDVLPVAAQPVPHAPAVTVAKPVLKDVVERDEFVGRFEATDAVEFRSRVSGYLSAVSFREGGIVNKGDLLFTIDKRPYQAALDQAEAAVASAQSRVVFASSDYDRAAALSRTGNISDQVLDQRRNTLNTSRGDLLGAQAAARTSRLNLGFTEIRAPMTGRIGRRLVSEGNLVTADQTLLSTIVSLDPIYFYFDVDERAFLAYQRNLQIGDVANGSRTQLPVMVALADEKDFVRKGFLDFLDNRVDQASGTIRVRASIENKDLFIRPGLFGTIQVPASPQHKGVLVPDEAIATDQDRRIVWVVADDNTVSARSVRPGPRIDGYRLIREGLTGDETIIVSGLQRVRPGTKVAPQLKELAQAQ